MLNGIHIGSIGSWQTFFQDALMSNSSYTILQDEDAWSNCSFEQAGQSSSSSSSSMVEDSGCTIPPAPLATSSSTLPPGRIDILESFQVEEAMTKSQLEAIVEDILALPTRHVKTKVGKQLKEQLENKLQSADKSKVVDNEYESLGKLQDLMDKVEDKS